MKVICVDHDHEMRSYVAMILEASLNCEVLEFSSVPECISYIEIDAPKDLLFVLCEIEINDQSAMELLTWFQTHMKQVPFIWMSEPVNRNKLMIRQSLKRGKAKGFIPKPFKDNDFFPVIDKIFKESANIRVDDEMDVDSTDWYSKVKKKNDQIIDADWDIHGKKASTKEDDADWSLKHESQASEQDADWSLKNESQASEQDADWSLKHESQPSEQDADWDLNDKDIDEDEIGFKKFKAVRILAFDKNVVDIYIQLSKEKYLKIFSEGESVEKERLQKYLDKGVVFLCIKKREFARFSEHFLSLIVSKQKKLGSARVEVRALSDLAAFDNIISTVKEIGITGAAAELIKKSITSNLDTISKMKDLNALLEVIYRKQNFLSEHSLLTSYIAGKIAMDTSWNSPQTLDKLSLAALFHDVSLEDSYLTKIHDMENERLGAFDQSALKLVEDHCKKSAKYLNEGAHIFSDVGNIIIQHHERPTGNGYPTGLSSSAISPLSCLFIIAEKYAHFIIAGKNPESLINDFKIFDTGNFKTPLKSFFNVFTQV